MWLPCAHTVIWASHQGWTDQSSEWAGFKGQGWLHNQLALMSSSGYQQCHAWPEKEIVYVAVAWSSGGYSAHTACRRGGAS